jgi:hypothetical protein
MKSNIRSRRKLNVSDFYNYLVILNNIITDYKKNHYPILANPTEIYIFSKKYLSGNDHIDALHVFILIKWISNEDFDNIFDYYQGLTDENKLKFVKLLSNLVNCPSAVKWISRPKTKLDDISKLLNKKEFNLEELLLLNKLFKYHLKFRNNSQVNFKVKKISSFSKKNEDYYVKLAFELTSKCVFNNDVFTWYLEQPSNLKTDIVKVLKEFKKNRGLVNCIFEKILTKTLVLKLISPLSPFIKK